MDKLDTISFLPPDLPLSSSVFQESVQRERESQVSVTRGHQGRRMLRAPLAPVLRSPAHEGGTVLQHCPAAAAVCPQEILPRQDISALAQDHSNLAVRRKHLSRWYILEQP